MTVETGRRYVRAPCPSCGLRFKVGEPKATEVWPAQLSLSERQMDLLLVAAAEFRDLCAECQNCHHKPHGSHDLLSGKYPAALGYGRCMDEECWGCSTYIPRSEESAVDFVDWIRPDALSPSFASPVRVDDQLAGRAR